MVAWGGGGEGRYIFIICRHSCLLGFFGGVLCGFITYSKNKFNSLDPVALKLVKGHGSSQENILGPGEGCCPRCLAGALGQGRGVLAGPGRMTRGMFPVFT